MDVEEATTEQFIGQEGTEEDNAPLLDDEIIFSTPASKVRKSTQILAALAATCGAFCLGTVLAWTSPVGKRLEEGELGFKVSASELSWVGSLAGLGAALVAPLAGQLVDKMGRRNSMLSLCVPLCLGWLLIAFAKNTAMLYAGRALTGASGGAFCVAIPVYISEIAHPPLRGALGSLFQLQLVMGVEMIYIAGPLLSIFWLSAICGFMSVFSLLALLAFAPESPSFLLRSGKPNAAHDALQWLWGPNFDLRPELNEMARQAASERSVSISRVFTQRSTWIAIGLMAFQQFTGVNCIVFYVEEIFSDAGGSVQGANAAIIVGGVQLAACLVSTLVVDCAGRRPLLLVSGTVLAACCTTLGAYFFVKSHGQDVSGLGWLPVASVCVYFVVFSLGFGPVPWVMLGELFAPEVKGAATSVASAVSWWLTFLTTCQFQPLVDAIGEGPTFWGFAALTALGVLFVAAFVPETKGRTLDQIQHSLNETSS